MALRFGRKLPAVAALVLIAALASACAKNVDPTQSSASPTSGAPTSETQGETSQTPDNPAKDGGSLTMASASPVKDWNPLSVGGDSAGQRSIQGPLYPHPFITGPDWITNLNEALLISAEVTKSDPMTVVYQIQPDAVWSDDIPISADDFIYTQAVQDPDRCAECKAAFTAGYDLIKEVTGSEDGKTVTMVYEKPFAQWQALFPFLLPKHIADGYGDMATSFNVGFGTNVPAFSGGPYIVSGQQEGISLTLGKNPKWYGDPAHLDEVGTLVRGYRLGHQPIQPQTSWLRPVPPRRVGTRQAHHHGKGQELLGSAGGNRPFDHQDHGRSRRGGADGCARRRSLLAAGRADQGSSPSTGQRHREYY